MFREGIDLRLQAELECKGDDDTLSDFITLFIMIDNLLRNSLSFVPRPQIESFSSSSQYECLEQKEPMKINYARVPTAERQRRYNEGLCYYCGQSGRMQSTCQSRRRKNQVFNPKVSITTVLATSNNFSLPSKIFLNDQSNFVAALIDSGSALSLINKTLDDRLQIPTIPCFPTITVTAINNHPIGSGITHQTVPVMLQVGLFLTELIP